jgi:DNA-binding beta-propeller fold protein YncE
MNLARSSLVLLFLSVLLFTGWLQPAARAEVEWSTLKSLNLENKPLDVATDVKGANLYILTPGEVLIYTANGKDLKGRISVDKGIERIAVSPRGDQLFLTDQTNKTLSILKVDFVQNIDVTGNPFKGPANAPVTIAVFSDFQ